MQISLSTFFAGDFTFTIETPDAGHRTYRVTKSDPTPKYPTPAYFVKLLTGPADESDYTYLGKLDEFTCQLIPTAKSKLPKTAYPCRLLNRILLRIWGDQQDAFESKGFKLVPLQVNSEIVDSDWVISQQSNSPVALSANDASEFACDVAMIQIRTSPFVGDFRIESQAYVARRNIGKTNDNLFDVLLWNTSFPAPSAQLLGLKLLWIFPFPLSSSKFPLSNWFEGIPCLTIQGFTSPAVGTWTGSLSSSNPELTYQEDSSTFGTHFVSTDFSVGTCPTKIGPFVFFESARRTKSVCHTPILPGVGPKCKSGIGPECIKIVRKDRLSQLITASGGRDLTESEHEEMAELCV